MYAELVTLEQLIMVSIVSVILDSMEIEIYVNHVIVHVVDALEDKPTNV